VPGFWLEIEARWRAKGASLHARDALHGWRHEGRPIAQAFHRAVRADDEPLLCAYCDGELRATSPETIDHFLPTVLARRLGLFELDLSWMNLFPACVECNSTHKRDRWSPLLLRPDADAVDAYFAFNALTGALYASPEAPRIARTRVRRTIRILGLNTEFRCQARLRLLRRLQRAEALGDRETLAELSQGGPYRVHRPLVRPDDRHLAAELSEPLPSPRAPWCRAPEHGPRDGAGSEGRRASSGTSTRRPNKGLVRPTRPGLSRPAPAWNQRRPLHRSPPGTSPGARRCSRRRRQRATPGARPTEARRRAGTRVEERRGARRMWRRVDLKNYRSIESVSVELAPFSALVGPNGSGKSNFADALVFARDVATDAAAAVERRGGIAGLRRWRPTKPSDVTVDIRAAKLQAELDTNYVRHQFTIHSGASGRWTFRKERIEAVRQGEAYFWIERTAGKLKMSPPPYRGSPTYPGSIGGRGAPVQPPPRQPSVVAPAPLSESASAMVLARQYHSLSSEAALRNVRRVRLNPEAMRQPQPTTENTRLDESGSNVGVAYRSLRAPAQAQVLAAMQKIVPGLSVISVEPFDRFLLLKFDQRQPGGHDAKFSATEMSEGALRALGILVAAQQMTPDELLIIEEPEVSIHVGAAQLLFDVLEQASRRGAVLVTTHSADLLDAARDEEILVCSYRDGVTNIGPLASAQREIVRQGVFSVAELMRSEPLRIEGEAPAAAEP
jgi:uncharacterized protein (TIGR02646 family)